jgi:hypothetical protein
LNIKGTDKHGIYLFRAFFLPFIQIIYIIYKKFYKLSYAKSLFSIINQTGGKLLEASESVQKLDGGLNQYVAAINSVIRLTASTVIGFFIYKIHYFTGS